MKNFKDTHPTQAYLGLGLSILHLDHASRRLTFDTVKENMDENGVITINRQDPEPTAVKGQEAVKLVAATNGLKLNKQAETVKATAEV
jgi:hypothetical protein